MALDILKLIFWLGITLSIGWSILSIISYNRKHLFFIIEKIALSYAFGLAAVSIEMAILSSVGIKFSIFSILVWWLPVFLTAFILAVSIDRLSGAENTIRDKSNLSFLEKFCIFGISFEVFYAFFRALIKPLESYDSIAIYALKSKIFYLANIIPHNFFTDLKSFVPHIEYPLLIPLSETYFYTFLGSLNDQLVKVIFPLYYISILAVFYSILRRFLGRKYSLLFTFLLATVPQFKDYATIGYTDLPLAFYYSVSALYLFLWMKEKETLYLILSFLTSIFSVWTKTEGLMLTGINLMVVVIYILLEGRVQFRQAFYYLLFSLVSISAYIFIRKTLGLGLHGDVTQRGPSDLARILLNIKNVPSILYEYQIQFFGPKKWNIVWIIFLFTFVANFKNSFSRGIRFITVTLIFIFLGYTSIYIMLSKSITWYLSTTASRFFIHFLPLVLFWLVLIFKELKLEI